MLQESGERYSLQQFFFHAAGSNADFVIMDEDYHVLETIIDGKTYYKA